MNEFVACYVRSTEGNSLPAIVVVPIAPVLAWSNLPLLVIAVQRRGACRRQERVIAA